MRRLDHQQQRYGDSMNKYRVEVAMTYWDTVYVEANNEAEAKATALDLFNETRMRQGEGEVTDVRLIYERAGIKTLGELEAESTDGFRNPERN
jgi:hypothetical protein